jgi:hypothetical protein
LHEKIETITSWVAFCVSACGHFSNSAVSCCRVSWLIPAEPGTQSSEEGSSEWVVIHVNRCDCDIRSEGEREGEWKYEFGSESEEPLPVQVTVHSICR